MPAKALRMLDGVTDADEAVSRRAEAGVLPSPEDAVDGMLEGWDASTCSSRPRPATRRSWRASSRTWLRRRKPADGRSAGDAAGAGGARSGTGRPVGLRGGGPPGGHRPGRPAVGGEPGRPRGRPVLRLRRRHRRRTVPGSGATRTCWLPSPRPRTRSTSTCSSGSASRPGTSWTRRPSIETR